jgi:hypothetical protein
MIVRYFSTMKATSSAGFYQIGKKYLNYTSPSMCDAL